jgi:hypothetical protein
VRWGLNEREGIDATERREESEERDQTICTGRVEDKKWNAQYVETAAQWCTPADSTANIMGCNGKIYAWTLRLAHAT